MLFLASRGRPLLGDRDTGTATPGVQRPRRATARVCRDIPFSFTVVMSVMAFLPLSCCTSHKAGSSIAGVPLQVFPLNHLEASSATWPKAHDEALSEAWPPSHGWIASSTWPRDHDRMVSATWWAGHRADDSARHVFPPLHDLIVSGSWIYGHTTADSQAQWPPNHSPVVSKGWGREHVTGVSLAFPPGHSITASRTWPGPEPNWPAGHEIAASRSWSHPVGHHQSVSATEDATIPPRPWPVAPANHAWLTSFSGLIVPAKARDPWPGNANTQPER